MSQFDAGTFILVPNKKKFNQLSRNAITTWFALCYFANEDGKCWPSRKTLADAIQSSEGSIKKGLVELEEKKWIKTKQRKREDGGNTSNHYTMYLV